MLPIVVWGLVALALAAVVVSVKLTWDYFVNEAEEKFCDKYTKQVVLADVDALVSDCRNEMKFSELNELKNKGATHICATVDNRGQVKDVELLKNTDRSREIDRYVNRTGEGLIVIER